MESSPYWRRFSQQRLSRRRALKAGLVGLGGAGIALAGCGGGEEEGAGGTPGPEGTATPRPYGTPRYGDRLILGLSADPGGLDPHLCVTCYWVAGNIHGFMYSVDIRDQSTQLQMASSYERVDEVTYIWKLRPGIKFHNVDPTFGREVVADDIVYSMTRRRDDPASQNDKQLLRDFTASFEATDKYTFRLVTTRPYAPAYDEIGNPSYAIVPHEAVEKWGDLQHHAVGCGAFILRDFVKAEKVILDRNPDFYMEGLPYTDGRDWIIVTDPSTLLQAFKTKQHDYTTAALDKLKVQDLKKLDGVIVRESDNFWHPTLLLRVDRPPFVDKRMWEAVDLAVDRQDLIDKIAFGEGKFAGPIVADLKYWALPQEELREFYKVDLQKAKQLMEAAGYGDGVTVDVPVENVATMAKYAEVVKEHLAKIGINCNLQLKELGVYLAQHLYQGNFQMTWYINLPYVEPDRPLGNWFSKGAAGFNFAGYNNPEMDEWVWKERSEFDPEKRRQIIHDAQRAMMREHGPQINTTTSQGWVAYWDWVHGPETSAGMGSWGWLGVDTYLTERH